MIRFSSVRRWYFGAPGGVFRRSFVAIYASLCFLCLQESIQPTPDFFNPRLKPAQQANHSRQNLPVLHWKLARAYQYFVGGKKFSGFTQQKEEPSDTIPVYYNPKDPATHVLKRKTSEDELVILIMGGVAVLAFIGVNVCLYKSKKKKISSFG